MRLYELKPAGLSFVLKGERPIQVTTSEFESGEALLRIDGKTAGKVDLTGGSGRFDVPSGEHSVELVKKP